MMTDAEKKLLQAQHRLEEAQREIGSRSESQNRRPFEESQFWKRAARSADDGAYCTGGLSDNKLRSTIELLGGLRETGDLPLFSQRAH